MKYWKIHTSRDLEELAKEWSWLNDMKTVPQDPRYHAEGDVFTHTCMVVEALMKEKGFGELNEQDKEILFASALLHDVEKRSTTEIHADGSITSYGHARKGENTSRTLLFKELHCPFHIREQITAIVRYHGLPIWIMEKSNPQKALLEATLRVKAKWLALFARADFLGRISDDKLEMLERIDFFEEFAREHQVLEQHFPFLNEYSRFLYFYKNDGSVYYDPFDNLEMDVYLLSGLPGMGKDKYIQQSGLDLPVISLDDMRRKLKIDPTDKEGNGRIIQEAKEMARVYLRKKQSFIWNATNITQQMRSQLIDLFVIYNARVNIVYMEVPYKLWLQQNKNREFPVPENVMLKMLNKLEIPQLSEAHRVNYFVE